MIRIASQPKPATPEWHETLLRLLPAIRRHAWIAFRNLDPESRAEAIQNAVCCACAAVARLAELNKLDLCYASVLARFAVAQTRDGRMLGRSLNCKDISSSYCRRKKGLILERLDKFDREEQVWEEILIPRPDLYPSRTGGQQARLPPLGSIRSAAATARSR
jgi:hypothetical protein